MARFFRFAAVLFCIGWAVLPGAVPASAARTQLSQGKAEQETGFLNRRMALHGAIYRYQVYLPEEWRRDDRKQWPILLFLHGRGERGSEGMWQTQFGLPQAVRDHPERWPFVIVMPQCPLGHYWTDPDMETVAMEELDQETAEFHADPERTYLSGLSMGGYGAWELARIHPKRWAAVAIAAGGVFWSYAPERLQQAATLPAEYAKALGRTPVWLFHGNDDNIVSVHQSDLMFQALKANGGHVRLWIYQGFKHDCWARAYNEPELPRWLLAHHLESKPNGKQEMTSFAERLVIPYHPPAMKLTASQLDNLTGEYRDAHGHLVVTVFRQGDAIYEKNLQGEIAELAAESPTIFFYRNGSATIRLIFERDTQGRVNSLVLRDDRHEERWEKRTTASSR